MKNYRSITKKSGDYDKKYMNIKFDSDDNLPLNRMVEIPRTTIQLFFMKITMIIHKFFKTNVCIKYKNVIL